MKDIVVIVPAFEPDKKEMLAFMHKLIKEFKNIVVVDDGSGEKYSNFFRTIEDLDVPVLKHCVNMGKGRALKTAFNYICNTYSEFIGVVTADCDGQHNVEDIKKCAITLKENPSKLILGVRNFEQEDVPFKSRYGNRITRNVFKIFIGLNITDTQTGLRGLSKKLVEHFITTKGERYEYETNMLIDCKLYDIEIKEVPISTIYINNNVQSHFNPVKDSIIIYKLFFKYILASLSSFVVDILLFTIFVNMFAGNVNSHILLATILARIVSSTYNFFINGRLVFKKMNNTALIKYAALVVFQMFVSGCTVTYLSSIMKNISSVAIKIVVDLIIFVANFIIQREWIFKRKR